MAQTRFGGIKFSRNGSGTGSYDNLYIDTVTLRAIASSTQGSSVQIWKDGTPTYASAVAGAVPGNAATNDLYFANYNATNGWKETFHCQSSDNTTGCHLQIPIFSGGRLGIKIIAAASQTADMQEWLSNSSSVLARVTANGELNGPIAPVYAAKTSAYTAAATDCLIACNATSGTFAVTLPAAASTTAGHEYVIKKTDSSANAVTVTPNGSDKIDGASTYSLSAQYKYIRINCDGTANWLITGSN